MVDPRDTATETERIPSSSEIVRLEESFHLFTQTTRELEDSYNKLRRRANRIDVELKKTNETLAKKVKELGELSDNRMSILEALPNGIVVIKACRSIASVNPAAERILGRRSTELVGRNADAIVGPTGDRLLSTELDPNASKHSWDRDIVALDGSRRRVSYTVATLPDGCELHVLNDLTVLTRLREQVGRLDTMAALGEMAAGVAHEIRNPLNGIDGFAGLLARSLENSGDQGPLIRYAENIRRGVREVNDIITNLLTFASPENIRLNPIAITMLVKEVVDGFLPHLNSDVHMDFRTDVTRQTMVDGDPVKLKIIFNNLIQNAIQAVGLQGRVVVRLQRIIGSNSLLVSVEDNGGGISPEVRDRLFQPFCTTKASGTGLGLAIASKFASLHHAEIACSDIDNGASFTVTLPVKTEEISTHA